MFFNNRQDFRTDKLDVFPDFIHRNAAKIHLRNVALLAKLLVLVQDLIDYLLWRPHVDDASGIACLGEQRLREAPVVGHLHPLVDMMVILVDGRLGIRSEERRVGKECRSRWWTYD